MSIKVSKKQMFLNLFQAEYTIQPNGTGDSPHVQKANIPMEKGGYLIYGTAHMHSGVVNATLYGQVINNFVTIINSFVIYLFAMLFSLISL